MTNQTSDNNKRIAKNAIFLHIRMAIVMIVNLYTTRVILHNLGVEDYGIYNVVYGFVTMFTVFNVTLTAGINRYYNYEIGRSGKEGVKKVYNVAIRIQALLVLAVFFIVETLGLWYINGYMVMQPERIVAANWVFQFSVLSMIFLIIQNPFSSATMAFEKMGFFAIVSIVDVFLKLAIAICICYSPIDNLIFYGALMGCISVLDFLAYFFFCKSKFPECISIERNYDKSLFRDMLKFSGWMSLDPIAYSINGQGVNMLINSFFGTVVNTAFGIANQVGQAIDTFCMNLSTAFRPQMVQSYSAGDINRSLKLFVSMTKISFLLFLLICIPFMLNIEYIYDLWLGDTYPKIAISISLVFIMVKVIGCLNHPISYIIMAKGNLKRYMIVTSVITSSIIILAYLLLRCGLPVLSVFIAMFVIAIINQMASIYVLSKEIPEIPQSTYYKRIIYPCLLLALIVSIIVYASHILLENNIIKLISDFVVSAIVTLLTSYYICMDKAEKNLFITLINKIIRR